MKTLILVKFCFNQKYDKKGIGDLVLASPLSCWGRALRDKAEGNHLTVINHSMREMGDTSQGQDTRSTYLTLRIGSHTTVIYSWIILSLHLHDVFGPQSSQNKWSEIYYKLIYVINLVSLISAFTILIKYDVMCYIKVVISSYKSIHMSTCLKYWLYSPLKEGCNRKRCLSLLYTQETPNPLEQSYLVSQIYTTWELRRKRQWLEIDPITTHTTKWGKSGGGSSTNKTKEDRQQVWCDEWR